MGTHKLSPSVERCDSGQAKGRNPTEQDKNKRGAPFRIFGVHSARGWRLGLFVVPGVHELTPDRARTMAADLAAYADVLEGRDW